MILCRPPVTPRATRTGVGVDGFGAAGDEAHLFAGWDHPADRLRHLSDFTSGRPEVVPLPSCLLDSVQNPLVGMAEK